MGRKPPADDPGDRDLRVTPQHDWAAGIPAVRHSLGHGLAQMGPTRTLRTLRLLNHPDGFDCPGCAWPEPDHAKVAEFCENGAKAVAAEATTRRVDPDFFAAHPISALRERSAWWLEQQGRLTAPMYKPPGADHYQPIGWSEAFALAGRHLKALDSPDEAIFYTSGKATNEAAFTWQLFARVLGTNNLPDCSNMCHESSGVALTRTVGIGKGTVTHDDVERAELVLVVGQNPGTNHPRMLSSLEACVRNGGEVVAVNPLREAGLVAFRNPQNVRGVLGHGTPLAVQHVPVRLGGDLALFQLVNRMLVERDAVDHDFVERFTEGFPTMRDHLEALEPDALLAKAGVPLAAVAELADRIARAERLVICWAMGLTQHRDSVDTIQEVVNTILLRGAIGKPGAGLCPVRGHSNVQGDRTMGVGEDMPAWFLDALGEAVGFEPPRERGYASVEAVHAMREGEAKVFLGLGGNFARAMSDTEVTDAALRRCRLTVQIATKLNHGHLVTGDEALLLPCLGRSDDDGGQYVTVEDSMGMVHRSRGRLHPLSPLMRSETAIVCGLAEAAVGSDLVDWAGLAADHARIRSLIERVVPGFEGFERRLEHPGGFALPNGPRDSRTFHTPTGKAQLTVNVVDHDPVPAGRLLLQTLRSHDQFNTTIYGLDDRYRGISNGRMVVFVSRADISALGLRDGGMVDIVSEWHGEERRVKGFRVVPYDTPRGCIAAYYPETNPLIPLDATAKHSGTPAAKSIVVRLERSA